MGKLRRVFIESPYRADSDRDWLRNLAYARACMADCLSRGEAPFASHLLYTQDGVLDDSQEDERMLGIAAGLSWAEGAEATVVYTDLGITDGMGLGIEHAMRSHRFVQYRTLPDARKDVLNRQGFAVTGLKRKDAL